MLKKDLTDLELIEELRLIVKYDKEHRDKTEQKDVNVTMLEMDRNASCTKSKETLSATVERVVTDKVNKMEAKLDAKLDKVLGEVISNNKEIAKDGNRSESGRKNQSGPGRNKKFIKCDACEGQRAFCNHCTNCGKSGHKRYCCPDPPKEEKNE